MRTFPLTVIPALLFSLVDSQLTLPSHLKHVLVHGERLEGVIARRWKRTQAAYNASLQRFIDRVYRPQLELALTWRYQTAAIAFAIVALTAGAVGGGWVRMSWFPEAEADNVVAILTMPLGTTKETTATVLARLEASARRLEAELNADSPTKGGAFHHVLTSVGEQP